ncbi:MAG: type fimbrial biosis protein PilY1 [Pseudomonadota bacterium]
MTGWRLFSGCAAFAVASATLAQSQTSLPATAPASAVAVNEISTAPLRFLAASVVKPNLYFILDDSGSMQWSYLGDDVVAHGYENAAGYRSSACNKIYYNPAISYALPVDSGGQPYPPQNFNAALYDGFQSDSIRVDLATGFMPWRSASTYPATPATTTGATYTSDCWSDAGSCTPGPGMANLPGAAYYLIYTGTQPERLGDNSDNDHCKDTAIDPGTPGASHWRKMIVGVASGRNGSDERQNFANWYSYYRTRMLMMKTVIGRAFAQFDERMRIGYSTTSETGVDMSRIGFLPIRDFDASHRKAFYDKLYVAVPVSGTPLRGALAKAGRLYAGKLLRDADDPVKYSCQQNFTLLSTDGYWNDDGETADYGPRKLDGNSDVGNQDHGLPRPMFDGMPGTDVRVATLTISTINNASPPAYTLISGVSVDGKPITARAIGVLHASAATAPADAAQLARRLASVINIGGYRAVADVNVITIIAPASAGSIASRPLIDAIGSLAITVSSFSPPSGRGPRINTLADVAAYYANTDLRQAAFANCGASVDLCANNVPAMSGQAGDGHQRMTTYTLGLGASGTLRYSEDYDTAAAGDFRAIVDGRLDWPDPIFFPGGERIDDLWHAAVNGGGRYFSARSPEALARALGSAMEGIRASVGAASSAATSSQQPVPGEDLLYAARYRTVFWDGDLEARRISASAGNLSLQLEWSAASLLDRMSDGDSDTRLLLMPSATSASGLKEFRWSVMNGGEQALFNNLCPGNGTRRLSQCATMDAAQQPQANGRRLVDYLRGQRGNEDQPDHMLRLFRRREHVMGAATNASPLHVGQPPFRYADDNYGEFRDVLAANRRRMVYLPANDGMLHAFDATNGQEQWAFMPSSVLPDLWHIADSNWSNDFRYLNDGTPIAGDICPTMPAASCAAAQWRTLVVSGLGAGGRAYYALDVTQPDRPALLWQFDVNREPNLGLAMGRPLIAKRRDGRWVVVIASGYANVNPGNGHGMLFVLDAWSGELLSRIDTGSGSASAPAGLAQLNAWVDNTLDNTAARLYGGDLLGNVWRFDIDTGTATLLARLDYGGRAQPVTTRPELTLQRIGNRQVSLVTVATGKLLGLSDVDDKSVQSVYTFRDDLGGQGPGQLQGSARMVQQQLFVSGLDERTVSVRAVDWTQSDGWYLNLDTEPGSGERVTLDPEQHLGVLRVIANVPDSAPCQPQAKAWVYQFDVFSGSHLPIEGGTVVARKLGQQGMISGAKTVWIDGRTTALLTDEAGTLTAMPGAAPATAASTLRRVSWRELD